MKKFGWSKVAILQQAEEVFISVCRFLISQKYFYKSFFQTVEDLENRCLEEGIEIVTRQSFLSDPSDAVRNLRRQDARIIVGLFYVVAARRVLCEMFKQQLYGKAHVWFFIGMLKVRMQYIIIESKLLGWYEDNWYEANLEAENISCTKEEMRLAAEGHLTTEAVMWNQNNQTTISGMTSDRFR